MAFYDDTGYRDQHWPVVSSVSLAIKITAALHRHLDEMPDSIEIPEDLVDRDSLAQHWQGLQSLHAGNLKLSQHVFGG